MTRSPPSDNVVEFRPSAGVERRRIGSLMRALAAELRQLDADHRLAAAKAKLEGRAP